MGVENKPDRLVGHSFDLRQDLARTPGEVCVDHQDVVLKYDPGAVCRLPKLSIALPEVDTRREFFNSTVLGPGRYKHQKSECRKGNQADTHGHQCIPDRVRATSRMSSTGLSQSGEIRHIGKQNQAFSEGHTKNTET